VASLLSFFARKPGPQYQFGMVNSIWHARRNLHHMVWERYRLQHR